jgi:hypothetical protein
MNGQTHREAPNLIVPGTTIAVTLLPSYVEVRDKGVLKKKIPVKNRSFDDVCSDLEGYFREAGKKLPPGIARETLQKLGVPQVKKIVSDLEPTEKSEVSAAKKASTTNAARRKVKRKPLPGKTKNMSESVAREATKEQPKGIISGIEYRDVEEALSLVESLSDSFLASKPRGSSGSVPDRSRIRIEVEGTEEIVGAPRLRGVIPERVSPGSTGVSAERTSASTGLPKREMIAKALILGEEGVGKSCLIEKGALRPLEPTGDADKKQYVSEKLIELEDYIVTLQVWSFDAASASRVTRKAFYQGTGAIIIVYSTSDRWSFESIDFWLKESTSAARPRTPIIIVGNKTDLRANAPLVDRETPVSQEEGLKLAGDIASKFGSADKPYPIAFVETSCATGQGVDYLFRITAELYVKSSDQQAS